MASERFEMRLDEDLLVRVDEWRADRADVPSRAQAVRRLTEFGLKHSDEGDVVRFTDGEKMIISMLSDVYKRLNVKGEIDPEFVMETIWGGHSWALRWELSGLYHEHEDSPATVREVVDFLDMWSFIESGFEQLSVEDKETLRIDADPFGTDVRFAGFDGNNESEYIGVARMFVEQMGRWSIFKGRELNSHHPTLHTYRRMFRVFEPMRKTLIGGRNLDVKQLTAILRERLKG